ncbi:MAG: polymer-forming cytoskeletal protein [Dehalococcoidia bacterium]|nr:polymer-forming cytoskeletal protein [Dehalococcoidia bacterium]
MQLKKTRQDDRYTDLTSGYPDQPETPDEYTVNQPRTPRGRDPEAEVEARQPARQESVIDADSSFDGKYETAQDLRILGNVSGEIVCRGLLTVERDASAKAKIQARDVQVRGRIEGDLTCSGRLTITASGVVSGTIKVATLVVEEGATVRGTVETAAADSTLEETTERPRERTSSKKEQAKDSEESGKGSNGGRWNNSNRAGREVPSFALVSSEERATDRN